MLLDFLKGNSRSASLGSLIDSILKRTSLSRSSSAITTPLSLALSVPLPGGLLTGPEDARDGRPRRAVLARG